MLLSAFIKESTARLENLYPSPEARGMVLMLCRERLGVESWTHIVEPAREVPSGALDALRSEVERMAEGEPLQYVLGYAEFRGRRFKVSPSVLIPRPETEELVEKALVFLKTLDRPARALDLCTGSGCIAWSVALEAPDTDVSAVDISADALALAGQQFSAGDGDGSAFRAGHKDIHGSVPAPVFLQADILGEIPASVEGPFDLILSNPPYIMDSEKAAMRRNVLDFEPGLALFVPDSDPLLFYRAVARWSSELLAPGGLGIVEINETLGEETAAVFRDAGFGKLSVFRDFFNKNRFVTFQK